MQYQQLGISALAISKVSLGCMSLSKINEDATAIIHSAFTGGITFFDTADIYEKGENEILLGNAIKTFRSKIVLATKVGNQYENDGKTLFWKPTKKYILSAVDESLRRLQTHYIDLCQLHGGTIDDPIDDIIEAFETLVQQGKIRYYGLSTMRKEVIQQYAQKSKIISVMMQYNLLDKRIEEPEYNILPNNNIGIIARGTLAKGMLINKPATAYLNYTIDDVQAKLQELGVQNNSVVANTKKALNFVLANPAITTATVGVSRIKQLDNLLIG